MLRVGLGDILSVPAKGRNMERWAKRILARAGLAACGAWTLGACILGGADAPPTIAGHFGDRLEGLPREQQLDSSLKALEMMKAKTGGRYRYRAGSFSWTGFGTTTWIWVEGGVAVRRTYSSTYRDSLGKERPGNAWTETGDEVGSRQEGHPPVLLDSLYRLCRESLQVDTTAHRMYFSLDHNYILGSCGNIHKLLADAFMPQVSVDVRWD